MTLQETSNTLAKIGAWLDENRPEYSEELRPGANDAALNALEVGFKITLSPAFRALYHWHDGQK
jgi:cell wall assembly regulator SMI1